MRHIIDPPHSRSAGSLPAYSICVHLCPICGFLFSSPFVAEPALSEANGSLPFRPSPCPPHALQDHLGVKTGSFRGRFGVDLGSFGGRFGVVWGSIWGRFGVGLGSVSYHVIVSTETLTPGPASPSLAPCPRRPFFTPHTPAQRYSAYPTLVHPAEPPIAAEATTGQRLPPLGQEHLSNRPDLIQASHLRATPAQ